LLVGSPSELLSRLELIPLFPSLHLLNDPSPPNSQPNRPDFPPNRTRPSPTNKPTERPKDAMKNDDDSPLLLSPSLLSFKKETRKRKKETRPSIPRHTSFNCYTRRSLPSPTHVQIPSSSLPFLPFARSASTKREHDQLSLSLPHTNQPPFPAPE